MQKFGIPAVVAINRFVTDTDKESSEVMKAAESCGAKAFLCTHWSDGGRGIEGLARHVVDMADSGQSKFKPLYPDDMPLRDKVRTIATEVYRAADIACDASIEARFKELQAAGNASGLRIEIAHASNDQEIESAFATFSKQQISAVMVGSDAFPGTAAVPAAGCSHNVAFTDRHQALRHARLCGRDGRDPRENPLTRHIRPTVRSLAGSAD